MSENALVPNFGIRHDGGVLLVNSRVVAEHFEKRHADVIRSIEQHTEQNAKLRYGTKSMAYGADGAVGGASALKPPNIDGWFRLVKYVDTNGREHPSYDMTRDGFALLGMSFTGEKAWCFKVAIIDEFDRMEAALRERQAAPAIDLNNPAVVDLVLGHPAVQDALLNSPVRLRNMLYAVNNRALNLEISNAVLKMDIAERAPQAVPQAVPQVAPQIPVPDRISAKLGECSLRQASKAIFGTAEAIFSVLQDLGWLYKNGSGEPQQAKLNAGYLVLREVECGSTRNVETMITAEGRAKLVELLETMTATAPAPKVVTTDELSPKSMSILLRSGYLARPAHLTGRRGRPKKYNSLNGVRH